MRYRATALAHDKEGNPTFNGKTCGIQFTANVAHFDDISLSPAVLRNYKDVEGSISEHIATKLLQDFHYQVEVNVPGTGDWIPFRPGVTAEVQPVPEPAGSDINFDLPTNEAQ
jgi:hypothetical protein